MAKNIYLRSCYLYTCSYNIRIMIFKSEKAKIYICNLVANVPPPELQFLQLEKRKYVFVTLQLIFSPLPYYNFYKQKNKNRYIWPDWHTYSWWSRICNQKSKVVQNILDKIPSAASIAASTLRFLHAKTRKLVLVTSKALGIYQTSYFGSGIRYLQLLN